MSEIILDFIHESYCYDGDGVFSHFKAGTNSHQASLNCHFSRITQPGSADLWGLDSLCFTVCQRDFELIGREVTLKEL